MDQTFIIVHFEQILADDICMLCFNLRETKQEK